MDNDKLETDHSIRSRKQEPKKLKNCAGFVVKKPIGPDRQELKKDPTTVGQFLIKIQDSQKKVNSSSDARESFDLEKASSSGSSHVPSQPLIFPNPREVRSRDYGLTRDTVISWLLLETVLKGLIAQEGPLLSVF